MDIEEASADKDLVRRLEAAESPEDMAALRQEARSKRRKKDGQDSAEGGESSTKVPSQSARSSCRPLFLLWLVTLLLLGAADAAPTGAFDSTKGFPGEGPTPQRASESHGHARPSGSGVAQCLDEADGDDPFEHIDGNRYDEDLDNDVIGDPSAFDFPDHGLDQADIAGETIETRSKCDETSCNR